MEINHVRHERLRNQGMAHWAEGQWSYYGRGERQGQEEEAGPRGTVHGGAGVLYCIYFRFPWKLFYISSEQLAEEKKEQEEREKKLAEQEKEVAETRDNLRRLEFEFREKNAILEILLKVGF